MLISSIVGIDSRSTMDMDTTIKGLPLTEELVTTIFKEISSITLDDDITFVLKNLEEIREKDEYNGYRLYFVAKYDPMEVPLKIDITTGDVITPREISYKYKKMFGDGTIKVLAYNLTTVLAEKVETILARGEQNTRLRDYYDSLEDLCKAEDVEESWVVNTISPINYFYNPASNQFE